MKRITSLLMFVLIFIFFGVSCTKPNNTEDKDKDKGGTVLPETVDFKTYGSYWLPQFDHKTMPIAGYNSAPVKTGNYSKNFLTEEQTFKDLSESGINTVMGLYDYINSNRDGVMTALDYSDRYNLSYLIAYSGAYQQKNQSTVRSALSGAMYKPALGGVMLSDEPGYAQFETMAAARDIFSSVIPNTLYHTNLFPDYANAYQLYYRIQRDGQELPPGGYSYEQYVNDYLRIYNPQVLSYDYYPFDGAKPNIAGGYFSNMSLIREKALEKNIPFWVYITTCSFHAGNRIPDLSEILWSVNTSLSYGSKGIQYFTFFLPLDSHEIFRGAMIDRDGNRTQVYNYVKQANMQIKATQEVLMQSKSLGLIKIGDTPAKIPDKDLLSSVDQIASFSGKHSLVGVFDFNGKRVLYITNNNITEEENLEITFDKRAEGYTVLDAQNESFNSNKITLKLSAGSAALIVLA